MVLNVENKQMNSYTPPKFFREFSRLWLKPLIRSKWKADKKRLPLKEQQFEQYYYIHRASWRKLGRFPKLIECRDFNDKVQWLKLFDQDPEIVRCVDKIALREFVVERVGHAYLVELYQVHQSFEEIDFGSLPESFVMKANHDSGSYVLVRDKSQMDAVAAQARISKALSRPYGVKTGQWAYAHVEPQVFVEEFIDPAKNMPPPADYKFFCVEGEVRFIHYIYDRGSNTKEQILDVEGRDMRVHFDQSFEPGDGFSKPEGWDEMISVAEKLSDGFKCVRVDLYYSNSGQIYVGEMTFWPLAGFYRSKGQETLGKLLDFDRTTYTAPYLG